MVTGDALPGSRRRSLLSQCPLFCDASERSQRRVGSITGTVFLESSLVIATLIGTKPALRQFPEIDARIHPATMGHSKA